MVATREARETAEIQGVRELGTQRGWKLQVATDGPDPAICAYRPFKYRCGARALVYVKHALDMARQVPYVDTPLNTRRSWEAGVTPWLAAGPEVSLIDRRFESARDWALSWEQVLQAPLALEKAGTAAEARSALRAIDRNKGWYMISVVFDLDAMDASILEKLVARQAPQLLANG